MARLAAPELADRLHRRWTQLEVQVRNSGVNLATAEARLPRPLTPTQRLARLHEIAHIRLSPLNWHRTVRRVLRWAEENGEEVDPGVASRMAKMLEENRVDYLTWKYTGNDLRPAREGFEWGLMPIPTEPLQATTWVLQLAWTIWASRGIKTGLAHMPPIREPDAGCAEFFDQCWLVMQQHPNAEELSTTVIRGCLEMYQGTPKGSGYTRDRVAAELSTFFLPEPEPQPDQKEEEREEEEEAEAQEKIEEEAKAAAQEEDQAGEGVGNDLETQGVIQIHDHTQGLRRSAVRISRRDQPQEMGTRLAFPMRYLIDRRVFGRKILNEAAIMIDGSGSMKWNNELLEEFIKLLPAVHIGIYGGFRNPEMKPYKMPEDGVFGRICILAKRGRIARYQGRVGSDVGFTGANEIDAESLRVLARWPGPRFWLSDGYVGGGINMGKSYPGDVYKSHYLSGQGQVVYDCNRVMRQAGILRVPDVDTMRRLLKRQHVTLYRSCVNWYGWAGSLTPNLHATGGRKEEMTPEELELGRRGFYPDELREEPVRFQL